MGGGGGGERARSMRVEMCGTAEVGSWRNSVGVKILEIVLGRVERGVGTIWRDGGGRCLLLSRANF